MDNKCPKCGKKLSVFYVKPNCPECGCNIMYYNMESRLEADSQQAEKEWGKVEGIIDRFTGKSKRKKVEKEDNLNEKDK